MNSEDKHAYRYWILTIGGLFALLGNSLIPAIIGIAIMGVGVFQIWEVLQSARSK